MSTGEILLGHGYQGCNLQKPTQIAARSALGPFSLVQHCTPRQREKKTSQTITGGGHQPPQPQKDHNLVQRTRGSQYGERAGYAWEGRKGARGRDGRSLVRAASVTLPSLP